ncbi:TPA: type IV secretion system protein, partial [Neisseria subflava]
GFAPIFILCLLFKKTAPLFQKWLYYGLATIFSGVMLGVMSDIAMDLVSNVGTSLFLSKEAMQFVTTKETLVGLADTATQQLGLGLILSTLL